MNGVVNENPANSARLGAPLRNQEHLAALTQDLPAGPLNAIATFALAIARAAVANTPIRPLGHRAGDARVVHGTGRTLGARRDLAGSFRIAAFAVRASVHRARRGTSAREFASKAAVGDRLHTRHPVVAGACLALTYGVARDPAHARRIGQVTLVLPSAVSTRSTLVRAAAKREQDERTKEE